ncbi:MAG TPA: response regulator [Ktedonobacteraceae bacterium]|nr:response regulator [Ktedonobacteraceae bacterium]
MRIGILEDSPAVSNVLKAALELTGYTVQDYHDATEFLASIHSEHSSPPADLFDLIIVDFLLPGELTGIQVISQVRRIYPDLPAFLISAAPIHTLVAATRDYPDIKVIQKPFRVSALLTAIEKAKNAS